MLNIGRSALSVLDELKPNARKVSTFVDEIPQLSGFMEYGSFVSTANAHTIHKHARNLI